MRAIMLAAGIGDRLSRGDLGHQPKALLEFGGLSLLERHVQAVKAAGVAELTLVVGYRAEDIIQALEKLRAGAFVQVVMNPDFLRGSAVSLWAARQVLRSGDHILFMDADVLYHPLVLERLIAASEENCFLYDRDFIPGDEPVKLCLRAGRPVEFRKKIHGEYEDIGEWIGFLKLSPTYAQKLAQVLDDFMAAGRFREPMEEAVRELLQASPRDAFAVCDVTGLPWIEIDFPEDVEKARDVILPAIERLSAQTRNT